MNEADVLDVLVLGAGAAGLMCAIEAGRRGRRVLVLEHADRAGKKILISGGGRCNFTNVNAGPENFLSANPHFAKSALARFTPRDFVAMVERHGIAYHEKTLGQLFCDRSAQEIATMLLRECGEAGVRVQTGMRVLSVARGERGGDARFRVETSGGSFVTGSLVVATGGLSIPKMGATALGYELARQFGHAVVEPRPGLVPLVFGAREQEEWCDLAGVSAEVVAAAGGGLRAKWAGTFQERMLITHRGLSGPAILQVSSYWRPGEAIELDLAPQPAAGVERIFAALLQPRARRDAAAVVAALRERMPARLAERWVALKAGGGGGADALSNAALEETERRLRAWRIVPAGTEGYAKAEVTVGGVDTAMLDARTMQSRKVPGLYFIGEVVDVTGWLGGYNFQWAWASGAAAGRDA